MAKSVLIVEDDQNIAELLRLYLEKEGYVAAIASDGGAGVEMFRKVLDEGQAGDNIGVLLRGTKKEDVERGMVLAKPGSVSVTWKSRIAAYRNAA